ncbi:hypothetical protein [Gordonia sp. SND2]|uniref:hypothetical protein n=1 Tax=Gordonia sp. SND2 TaxID=3388659 RepID=UPI00398A8F71
MTAGTGHRVDRDGPVALAAEILRGTADLRGAKCVEYRDEFDPDIRAADIGYDDESDRWAIVQMVCRACPARGACWEWSSELSHHARPRGPLADVFINPFSAVRRWERRSA